MIYKPIIKLFKTHSINAWCCGSTARDIYRGVNPLRNEIAAQTDLITLQKTFKDKIIEINEYNTTATMMYMGQLYYLYPLKLIKVTNSYYNFSYTDSLEEDSSCRDFTCHSLYFNPIDESWIDLNNGKADIDKKVIRMPGDPKSRILESKIRLLKAPILCAILGDGWIIDTATQSAIKDYRLKVIPLHSKQLNEELTLLLESAERPSKAFQLMRSTKLLEIFCPELNEAINIAQTNKSDKLDLFTHIMLAVDAIPINKTNSLKLRLAALLHDIGKPYTQVSTETGTHFYGHENIGAILAEKLLISWGFNKSLTANIILLIKNHLFDTFSSAASTKKLIEKVGEQNIHDLIDLRIADRSATGRPFISMKKIHEFRAQVNIHLATNSLENFNIQISDSVLKKVLSKTTDNIEDALPEVRRFLKYRIIYGHIENSSLVLKKTLHNVVKIKCPLDKPHLFKTWGDIEAGNVERFPNGNIACGVYCGFLCNKVLPNHK